jgi:hypothetical protein
MQYIDDYKYSLQNFKVIMQFSVDSFAFITRNAPQHFPKPLDLLHRVVDQRFCGTGSTHTMPPESSSPRLVVTSGA